ncbi:efflux RND transporter periplasmic adaptor subunit [Shewanella surugensis]|uniref:Efflux RND transporter periplasmic adaptor subunit n=1 Tax=Shewanella surugensis TaxID=212020 RepID=A0ABT0LH44_9GAMM|nr:efflux RND transporter periplasmic adaptor subunit [Shewanella surugensis]MCL1126486.1 efflux RND transporter periplasmic adaptor subunit [Shewanella surugensis]
MSHHSQRHTLLAFILVTLLSACGDPDIATAEPEYAIPVKTHTAKQDDVSSFYNTTAILEAPEEARVVTRLTGLINQLTVEEGDKVIQGQILAVLDAKRQEYDLAHLQAETQIIQQELQRLKKIKNKQFVSADSMAKLEYKLLSARAKRDLAQLQVSESLIRSPINGVIAKRSVKVGNMAQEFDELFYVVNQDKLHAILHLPEAQLPHLRIGQTAKIYTSHQKDIALNADVLRISPIIDTQSGTFKVTLQIPNPQAQLKAGMFTRVEIRYDTHKDVITVPYEAIIDQDNHYSIYVVNGKNVSKRQVNIGYQENNKVEILNGVEIGEKVVTHGQHNLKDQSLVEIINPLTLASSQS